MSTDPSVIARWLAGVGTLVAGQLSEAEAQAKIRAYVALLGDDYPASAFGAKSLKALAATCRFFPSYAEVVAHLDAWCSAQRRTWTDQDWLDQALSVTGQPSLIRVFLQHQPGALALFEAGVKALEGPPCDPAYAAQAVGTALRAIATTQRKSA